MSTTLKLCNFRTKLNSLNDIDSAMRAHCALLKVGIYAIALLNALIATQSYAAEGRKVTLTGEMIDTWCYVSQIMGSSEVVTGTAHHVCAVWCAAGGIPVGLLSKEDQKVYMVLSFEGDDTSVANEKILNLQSRELTVKGTAFELDGLSYLNIEEVVSDNGIVNLTHEKYGVIPGQARP